MNRHAVASREANIEPDGTDWRGVPRSYTSRKLQVIHRKIIGLQRHLTKVEKHRATKLLPD
jgi:hypothetical protein